MSRFCKLIAYVTVRHFVALEWRGQDNEQRHRRQKHCLLSF
jgi:ribosomal protein S13